MPTYANTSGLSNVRSWEETEDSITVTFGDGSKYLYTDASAGAGNVAAMKRLAAAGSGLNSYINRRVKKGYARKF